MNKIIGPTNDKNQRSSDHQLGKWRIIVDLSCPNKAMVNDSICKELHSLSYVSVNEAVQLILH